MNMWNNYLFLLGGVVCAAIGGELFVRGTVGLARWARIAPGIIGATVAAFATSSPELAVSLSSALAGTPEIALGDATGSNVVNVGLILAIALLFSGMQLPRDSIKRDFPVALVAPVLLWVLALDGQLSRLDGLLLIGVFIVWIVAVVVEVRRQRSAADVVIGEARHWLAVLHSLVGLGFLIAAGRLIVMGATNIARANGLDEFIIGATIVAIGTSIPELATTILAKLRRHNEVGLGTVLGSNIFNIFFIVALAAIILPITISWLDLSIALVFGLLTVAFTFPARNGVVERRCGFLLLVLYVAYLVAILQRTSTHG
jgi:cation:H+ antiporter